MIVISFISRNESLRWKRGLRPTHRSPLMRGDLVERAHFMAELTTIMCSSVLFTKCTEHCWQDFKIAEMQSAHHHHHRPQKVRERSLINMSKFIDTCYKEFMYKVKNNTKHVTWIDKL
jgi:hypothetical protein